MKHQASDEYALHKACTDLFFVWKNCEECQYNCYLCDVHAMDVEPILVLIGKEYGLEVKDFQIQEKDEEDE